jgi:hypothetical protein
MTEIRISAPRLEGEQINAGSPAYDWRHITQSRGLRRIRPRPFVESHLLHGRTNNLSGEYHGAFQGTSVNVVSVNEPMRHFESGSM